jgi:hypothetical protein
MKPSEFRGLIREMGRIPAERSTTYQKVRIFESENNHRDLLDEINDPANASVPIKTSFISKSTASAIFTASRKTRRTDRHAPGFEP